MKNALRDEIKQKRRAYSFENTNNQIVKNLINSSVYQKSKNIMLYYPLKYEVNLLEILKDDTKSFYLPKIIKDEMLCCPYKIGDALTLSSFKTKEPLTLSIDKNTIDLVIVPALCCDKNNFRLGYGKGYYDRFLKDFDGETATCIPKDFIVKTVYPENHDIKIKYIITD